MHWNPMDIFWIHGLWQSITHQISGECSQCLCNYIWSANTSGDNPLHFIITTVATVITETLHNIVMPLIKATYWVFESIMKYILVCWAFSSLWRSGSRHGMTVIISTLVVSISSCKLMTFCPEKSIKYKLWSNKYTYRTHQIIILTAGRLLLVVYSHPRSGVNMVW